MRVFVETPTHTIKGRVEKLTAGEDVHEGEFIVIDDDDGARLKVYGHNCEVTVIPACSQIGAELR